ncbi:ABC-type nitrate/sulfonate/bicarbonate transport system ATPase subunit [Streptosporangium becharense]|uniref:ABC-type nitrate/sulfonate/bicarbonate transport system ATPase subunit n=1 Tax=Streptosporangium becharense TaxID=1816182 RepID=A0A7W9IDZ8_9ACTN|nr:methyltransferase [Streptosporangium becharense]MBB2910042.1 ABC-type nitrate/sulfonate/bicarbonate transport system ATPase subunit [Streptosporangium becharense]MBB5819003.1 ABC-type nitrate/sulfonate/bicarbonate transport system ATPase subunit [Streptosporangium becharense]
MLEISNLTHTYGSGPSAHHALGGIDLKVAEGELVCIVGPSGCGKSTLLRSIAGLLRPSGGEVLLNGVRIEQTPDNLAVVFQDYSRSLFPWMSVADNVALPLRRKGMDKKQRREAAVEALSEVGLEKAAGKFPWQLSGGMQQRVSIARALAYRPALMLMDEPFGSVDAQTREDLEDLTLRVRSMHNMTILLITHDIDESVYVGDRVVVLSKSPAGIVGDLRVDLPGPRDQITTREHPDFVHLRGEVGRLVRGVPGPPDSAAGGAAPRSAPETATPGADTTGPDTDVPTPDADTTGPGTDDTDTTTSDADGTDTTTSDADTPASGADTTGPDGEAPEPGAGDPEPETDTIEPGADTPKPGADKDRGVPGDTGPAPRPERIHMSDPQAPIWDAIGGISRFAALATMAELGCADELRDGPLSVDELALRCGANPSSLARVFRQLAAMGVVTTTTPGVYELTEAGAALRSDVPGSLRPAVRMITEDGFWYGMGKVPQTVRTGTSAFVERFGPLYGYLKGRPEAGALFDDYMTARAQPFATAVASRYDFSGVGTVVDVAGGKGHILASVLKSNPEVGGVLFDQEQVVGGAKEFFAEAGLEDRCKFVAGDFFASVPAGGDVYLLGSVLHNWSDDDCVRILGNVREAVADDGRVLLIEAVVPDEDVPHISKDVDMRMLALFGEGMERSGSQYAELLDKAGFRLNRQLELPGGFSIVEALPL